MHLEQSEMMEKQQRSEESVRVVGTSCIDALACHGALTLVVSDMEPKIDQTRQLHKILLFP